MSGDVPKWEPEAGTRTQEPGEIAAEFEPLMVAARAAAAEVRGKDLDWAGVTSEVTLLTYQVASPVCVVRLLDRARDAEPLDTVDGQAMVSEFGAVVVEHGFPDASGPFRNSGGSVVALSDQPGNGPRFLASMNKALTDLEVLVPVDPALCPQP